MKYSDDVLGGLMNSSERNQNTRSNWVIIGLAVLVAAVACGAAGSKNSTGGPLAPLKYDPQISLAPLVDKVAPAVVNIRTKTKLPLMNGILGPDSLFEWFFGPRGPGQHSYPLPEKEEILRSMGSGFIIDDDGLVVTNRHVVESADEIEVQLSDERKFDAEVVGSDARTDIALLRIKNAKNLPAVVFGDSANLKVGDHVVAIGNPFGLDHTVTAGIVSAKERVIGAGPYDDFIQTDASINPGNSGGPLFNLRGEVVGINTAIAPQGQGIGFAIPSNLAKGLIESLRTRGKIVRGWLGISFQPLDEELAKAFGIKNDKGAVVANVASESPASKGGLKTGDVILEVNGIKLKSARELPRIVADLQPNATVPFVIFREGKQTTLKITIGELPEDMRGMPEKQQRPSKSVIAELGFEIINLDDQMRQKLDAEEIEQGVVVSRVIPRGPASGVLQEGDIIVEINQNKIADASDFTAKTKGLKQGDSLLLLAYRQGSWIYLVIKI